MKNVFDAFKHYVFKVVMDEMDALIVAFENGYKTLNGPFYQCVPIFFRLFFIYTRKCVFWYILIDNYIWKHEYHSFFMMSHSSIQHCNYSKICVLKTWWYYINITTKTFKHIPDAMLFNQHNCGLYVNSAVKRSWNEQGLILLGVSLQLLVVPIFTIQCHFCVNNYMSPEKIG